MKAARIKKGKGTFRLPQQKKIEKAKKTIERIEDTKDIFENTVNLRQQILDNETTEITITVISIILDFISMIFENHPKWFKSAKTHKRVIDKIDDISKAWAAIQNAFSDKSREIFMYKMVILENLPEPTKKFMKKRLKYISAIIGLIGLDAKMGMTDAFNSIATIITKFLIGAYIILYWSNEGGYLVSIFKKHILNLKLSFRDNFAIRTYIFVNDIGFRLDEFFRKEFCKKANKSYKTKQKKKDKSKFVKETKQLQSKKECNKLFVDFHRWKM